MATTTEVPDIDVLPGSAMLRLSQILRIAPISKSAFWKRIQDGKFPRPVKIGERTSAWYVRDVRRLLLAAPTVTPATIDPNAAAAVAKRVANRKAAKAAEAEKARRRAELL